LFKEWVPPYIIDDFKNKEALECRGETYFSMLGAAKLVLTEGVGRIGVVIKSIFKRAIF
jgi:hypothetical protein